MNKIISSFSGGKTSAYMTIELKRKHNDLIVLFANTGQERQETLDFVNECDEKFNLNVVWLESVVFRDERKPSGFKIVNYKTAATSGEPFEAVIQKYGIPNKAYPHCTRELKLNPIKSYLTDRKITDYKMAIGIRYDEKRRCSKDAIKNKLYYPLIDQHCDKTDINIFWEEQDFNLNLKDHQGNCAWCWKKSNKKLFSLIVEKQSIFDFPKRMEDLYGLSGHNINGNKRVFFRGNVSTELLFDMCYDLDKIKKGQISIFDFEDEDENSGCSESCEPFI